MFTFSLKSLVVYFVVLLATIPNSVSTSFVVDFNGRLNLKTGDVSESLFVAERSRAEERASIDRLLRSLENASFAVAELPGETFWTTQLLQLQTCLKETPEFFLQCHVIRFLMVIYNEAVMNPQYKWLVEHYFRNGDDLKVKWLSHALQESDVGKPDFVFIEHQHVKAGGDILHVKFTTSMNLIYMTYHLARFQRKTDTDISDMDLIVEFGGGFGAFCRLAFRQGFQGKYVIHDLEPFSILQKHYLTMVGLPVRNNDDWEKYSTGVWTTHTIKDLVRFKLAMPSSVDSKKSLLVAMYSMSEVPPAIREAFLATGPGQFGNYLFAFQPIWKLQDNLSWFVNFAFLHRAELAWSSWIDQGRDNRILVGSWKNAGALEDEGSKNIYLKLK